MSGVTRGGGYSASSGATDEPADARTQIGGLGPGTGARNLFHSIRKGRHGVFGPVPIH